MNFTNPQSHHLRTAIFLQSAIAKARSLTKNLDFSLTSGLIKIQPFCKIQAQTQHEPTRKARALLTTLMHSVDVADLKGTH